MESEEKWSRIIFYFFGGEWLWSIIKLKQKCLVDINDDCQKLSEYN
jgi:hypothetical protein